jgi:hypothetical protein
MENKLKTIGDFLELFGKAEHDHVVWIGGWEQLCGKDNWQSFIGLPFNAESVIELANLIARKVYCKARQWSEKRPYNKTLNWGHSFLHGLHKHAVANGINVSLSEIDVPLSPVESMIAVGLIIVDREGIIDLTDAGFQILRQAKVDMVLNQKNEATGRIRIIKVPDGPAPLHVSQAWVGLELPCLPKSGYVADEQDILKGKLQRARREVIVPAKSALAILGAVSPDAAVWWLEHGFPVGSEENYFSFGEDEVEIISGVERVPIYPVFIGDHEGSPQCCICRQKISAT